MNFSKNHYYICCILLFFVFSNSTTRVYLYLLHPTPQNYAITFFFSLSVPPPFFVNLNVLFYFFNTNNNIIFEFEWKSFFLLRSNNNDRTCTFNSNMIQTQNKRLKLKSLLFIFSIQFNVKWSKTLKYQIDPNRAFLPQSFVICGSSDALSMWIRRWWW